MAETDLSLPPAKLTAFFFLVPQVDPLVTKLCSVYPADSSLQMVTASSLIELKTAPFFGHIDILVLLFTPQEVVQEVLRNNDIKWVHSFSSGVSHYLYPEFINSPVPLTNSKGVVTPALVEFVFASMLHFYKAVPRFISNKAAKKWDYFQLEALYEKTILLLGFGNIGKAISKVAKTTFQMKVIGIKRSMTMCEDVDEVYTLEALHTLLPRADVLIMSLPDCKDTFNVIGPTELALMKSSALLVNIGRGNQLDEDALVDALQNRQLAGAALDVTKVEPLPSDSPLWTCPNLLIVPHCGCVHEDIFDDLMLFFKDNVDRFRAGTLGSLGNLIDKAKGY